ncbi:MAG: hypothetical protein ACOC02_05510 [Guyparkeria sp.]|uniref:hypothetical protein n=1 Tax=Guyparkeria sp. TaxID=2035736 RepID=UPI00397B1AD0
MTKSRLSGMAFVQGFITIIHLGSLRRVIDGHLASLARPDVEMVAERINAPS